MFPLLISFKRFCSRRPSSTRPPFGWFPVVVFSTAPFIRPFVLSLLTPPLALFLMKSVRVSELVVATEVLPLFVLRRKDHPIYPRFLS